MYIQKKINFNIFRNILILRKWISINWIFVGQQSEFSFRKTRNIFFFWITLRSLTKVYGKYILTLIDEINRCCKDGR